MLKVSAFYLEKQESFLLKNIYFKMLLISKQKKLCLLTQFSVKVLFLYRYVKITWHPSILHSQQSESYNNKSKGALRPPFWLYWMEIFTNSWVWSVLSFRSKFVLKSSEGSCIASRGNRHRTCSYDKGRPDTLTTASFTNCFEATPRIYK